MQTNQKVTRKIDGGLVTVDICDVDLLDRYTWRLRGSASARGLYVIRRTVKNRRSKQIGLHRVILERVLGHNEFEEVDHIDQNPLNNSRSNLRSATHAENKRNVRKVSADTTSRYKGVSWSRHRKCWQVHIRLNDKSRNLGGYNSEEDAALAYNRAAAELFGEFAWLNPIKDDGRNLNRIRKIQGVTAPSAKLTDDIVREIRRLIKLRIKKRDIAKRFEVSPSTITVIAQGKTWTHLL